MKIILFTKAITLMLVVFQYFGLKAQVILDYNNVSSTISSSGTFFNNFNAVLAGYEIPKGSGFTSILTFAVNELT
jgi:hypothetical protein